MNDVYEQDVRALVADKRIPWDAFDGKCVMVTGATGLVGGLCARAVAERMGLRNAAATGGSAFGGRLILPVRDVERARAQLADIPLAEFVPWDATQSRGNGDVADCYPSTRESRDRDNGDGGVCHPSTESLLPDCDRIIHCACPTASAFMVEHPVDTIDAIVQGTRSMLELARRTGARLCFVSSMEVYGAGAEGPLDESCGGTLNAMNVRSSYPQAKQLAETLCASFASQYGVQVCVARLAQTFGPGILATDRRVFAEFARCCRAGRNIKLLTDGSKRNMYVYTADAVRALLVLVARGKAGVAYNVANEATFCSVYEMAHMVAERFGRSTQVERTLDAQAAARYAVSGSIYMDTTRMRDLGWSADVDLAQMYERMLADWDATERRGEQQW